MHVILDQFVLTGLGFRFKIGLRIWLLTVHFGREKITKTEQFVPPPKMAQARAMR